MAVPNHLFVATEEHPLPCPIYLSVIGGLEAEENVDLHAQYTPADGGDTSSYEDALNLTVVQGIGDNHYYDAALDYMSEWHSRFFYDRKTYYGGYRNILSERMQIYVFPQSGSAMRVIDALSTNEKGIEAVANGSASGAFLVMNGGFAYNGPRWDFTSFATNLWDSV